MSLNISLYDGDNNCIADMNWLRNPYGLCKWAEDNAHFVWGNEIPLEADTLWYVCNHWAYDNNGAIDRAHFKRIVDHYWGALQPLETTYYFFDLPSYRQFIEKNISHFPIHSSSFTDLIIIDGSQYDKHQRLMIPVDLFKSKVFNLGDTSNEKMKAWMLELVDFADKLQDETTRFYCSN